MPGSKVLYGAHWVKKPQAYANEAKKGGIVNYTQTHQGKGKGGLESAIPGRTFAKTFQDRDGGPQQYEIL